jgi:DNA-nicking Smr family endonuclease
VKKRADHASDAEAFERAMADVVRLRPDPRGRAHAVPRIAAPRPGAAAAPASPVPDHVEPDGRDFAAAGVDRREVRRLKRGDYMVEATLDLHGSSTKDAVARVRKFLDASRHQGRRCVSIVHGRGVHSEGNAPVLKPLVRECLRGHPAVMAYADAPAREGGAGAVYVRLRA